MKNFDIKQFEKYITFAQAEKVPKECLSIEG